MKTLFTFLTVFILSSNAFSSPLFGQSKETPFYLKGTIYSVPEGTDRLPDFSKLKPIGAIYTDQLNVPPTRFDKGFPGVTDRFEWFAIDYKGKFFVPKDGIYTFALISDDGSKLIIDGKTVINNDGVHPPARKEGKIFLKKGLHSIEVQYFQGPRYYVALQLLIKKGNKFEPWKAEDFLPIKLRKDKEKTTLMLSDQVLFDFNKYDLKPQAQYVLREVAKLIRDLLKEHPEAEVVVEGHTDNVGSKSYNLKLSEKRALSVASFLKEQGVPEEKLTIVGKGETEPLFPNDTEEHRAKNRRVEIKIFYTKQK